MAASGDVKLHKHYPNSSVLLYNGVTDAHYIIGGLGIVMGYGWTLWAWLAGAVYLVFAFGQMYIMMPRVVCPNCVYYRMEDGRCVSGLNRLSRRVAKEGRLEDFPKRAGTPLAHNKLYMASFFLPIVAMVPALALDFSWPVLVLLLAVVGLLISRFMWLFPKVACRHCMAKFRCPNAKAMGLVKDGE